MTKHKSSKLITQLAMWSIIGSLHHSHKSPVKPASPSEQSWDARHQSSPDISGAVERWGTSWSIPDKAQGSFCFKSLICKTHLERMQETGAWGRGQRGEENQWKRVSLTKCTSVTQMGASDWLCTGKEEHQSSASFWTGLYTSFLYVWNHEHR